MSYIPKKNALFAAWLANLAGILATSYAAYGVASGDAAAITALNTAYQNAYTAAIEPTTRGAGTVAAANEARAAAESYVRPICVAISVDPNITAEQKIAVGVNTRTSMPSPIAAPVVAPTLGIQSAIPGQVTLTQRNPESGGKAKPYGAKGVELAAVIGTAFTPDPSAATPRGSFTKPLMRLSFTPEQQGLKVSLFARYVTQSGPGGQAQVGPWSAPLQFVAM